MVNVYGSDFNSSLITILHDGVDVTSTAYTMTPFGNGVEIMSGGGQIAAGTVFTLMYDGHQYGGSIVLGN